MIDAHIHLQDIADEKHGALIECLRANNISPVFCNGIVPADWTRVLALSQQTGAFPFIGVHPWFVDALSNDWEDGLTALLKQHRCGVGEIGLDRGPKGKNFKKQILVFSRQVELADELHRPFVLHCVNAWGTVIDLLQTRCQNGLPFIVHSFVGSVETLKKLLRMGALISISLLSLKKKDAAAVIKAVPENRLLLESDFPYLPGTKKDQVDETDYLATLTSVYQQTAEIRNIPVDVLTEQIRQNAETITNFL